MMPEIALNINKLYRSKYLYYTCYYFITAVLFVSGISKIINPQPLLDTLNLIKFLSEEIRIAIATILPLIELTLVFLLIGKIKVKLSLILTAGLFFVFLVFSVYGKIAGFNTDCGCFGNVITSNFDTAMIFRSSLFVIASFFLLMFSIKRKLTK